MKRMQSSSISELDELECILWRVARGAEERHFENCEMN